MATLKERQIDPRYVWMATPDFKTLEEKQIDYYNYFTGHPIYPAENYQKELQRIKDEWKNKDTIGAHRSLEKDLEHLYISYDQIRLQQILQSSIINQLFGQLFSYYSDMLNDFTIGYLSDEKFREYLSEFDKAIRKNKELGLDCYNKEPLTQIERKIAEILKTKN